MQNELTPVMAQYKAIKDNHKDALLFYRMGDFYELFYDDAIQASQALNIQLSARADGVPMCGVPHHAYEAYLNKLITNGYRVAICEQVETPGEAKKQGRKLINRRVVRVVSAGTLTEEHLLPSQSPNYLLAITAIKDQIYGIYSDISLLETHLLQCNINQLANELLKLQPSEILITQETLQYDDITRQLRDFYEKISVRPAHQFDSKNAQKSLNILFDMADITIMGQWHDGHYMACDALIHYLKLTHLQQLPKLTLPHFADNKNYLVIDAATRKSLELTHTNQGAVKGSLFDIINNCQTRAGTRQLLHEFNEPLIDIATINQRLSAVEFLAETPALTQQLRVLLKQIPDFMRALARMEFNRASPRDAGIMKQALNSARPLWQALRQYEQIPQLIDEYSQKIGVFDEICLLLNTALCDELPNHLRDGGYIQKGFSPELDNFMQYRHDGEHYIRKLEYQYREEMGYDGLKIKHNNIIGHFIEINSKFAQNIPSHFDHKQTLSGLARYNTPQLQELAQKISNATDMAIGCEAQIFNEICGKICALRPQLCEYNRAVAGLDILANHAHNAQKLHLTRPILDNSQQFLIKNGRHLPVERALKGDGKIYTANHCSLQDGEYFWLITGPNMAGKSTFLRQNAQLIILAQMGSFVPAEFAHLGVVDKLFSRVGASDDLTRGQSTFLVEMLETATILNRAGPNSFIIMDEVGRGTANTDGLSLASAIIEHIHNKIGARCLFATHYHECAHYAHILPNFKNYSLKILENNQKITFTHEIIAGAASQSYGIYVAKLAGLPRVVWQRAEQLVQAHNRNQNSMDLPLFFSGGNNDMAPTGPEKTNDSGPAPFQPIIDELGALDINNVSPKQAWDLLEKWQSMVHN